MHVCYVKKTECNKPNFGYCSYSGNCLHLLLFTKELSVVHRINKQRLNVLNETPFRFIPRTTIKPFIYYYGRHAVNRLKVFK